MLFLVIGEWLNSENKDISATSGRYTDVVAHFYMKMILCDIGDKIKFLTGGQGQEVTIDDLSKSDNIERIYAIQFHKAPKDEQLKKVVETIQRDPRIGLRFYGDYSEKSIDWTLLTKIQKLSVNLWNTESLDAIGNLTNLKELSLTKEVKSKVSLKIIKDLHNLETLFTSVSKNVESVGELKNLKFLSLREIKNKSLDFTSNLANLEELWISLGSYEDFNGLTKTLRKLSVHQVKGINDNTMTKMLETLNDIQAMELQNLKHIETIDFLSRQQRLSFLKIEGLKNLKTLQAVEKLGSLETIVMYDNKVTDKSILPLAKVRNVSIGDSYSTETLKKFKESFRGNSFWYRGTNLLGEFNLRDPFQREVK